MAGQWTPFSRCPLTAPAARHQHQHLPPTPVVPTTRPTGRYAPPSGFEAVEEDCPLDVSGVASGRQELWLIQLPNALVRVEGAAWLRGWVAATRHEHACSAAAPLPPPYQHAMHATQACNMHAPCFQASPLPTCAAQATNMLQAVGSIEVNLAAGTPCMAAFTDRRDGGCLRSLQPAAGGPRSRHSPGPAACEYAHVAAYQPPANCQHGAVWLGRA